MNPDTFSVAQLSWDTLYKWDKRYNQQEHNETINLLWDENLPLPSQKEGNMKLDNEEKDADDFKEKNSR
jgi:hypothetical protein